MSDAVIFRYPKEIRHYNADIDNYNEYLLLSSFLSLCIHPGQIMEITNEHFPNVFNHFFHLTRKSMIIRTCLAIYMNIEALNTADIYSIKSTLYVLIDKNIMEQLTKVKMTNYAVYKWYPHYLYLVILKSSRQMSALLPADAAALLIMSWFKCSGIRLHSY